MPALLLKPFANNLLPFVAHESILQSNGILVACRTVTVVWLYIVYMRYSLIILAATGLMACNQSPKSTTAVDSTTIAATVKQTNDTATLSKLVSTDKLITPGKSIGQTVLGQDAEAVFKRLGKPDAGDAAMGKALSIWYAGHDTTGHQTMIYTSRQMGTNDEAARVKQIRVTSPWFMTADGIHNGSTLQQIGKVYEVKKSATFTLKNETYTIYRSAKGIAFEIDPQEICKGIIVFDAASQPGQMYLPFYSNLKVVE